MGGLRSHIDSTFAYQYGGRQHSKADILDIIRLTELKPDLTFFMDVSVEEGLKERLHVVF